METSVLVPSMLAPPGEIGYAPRMLVLGIETSCDETGVAVYDTARGLLAQEVHTQAAMHADYGGVVPELASRDHIRRTLPLVERVLARAGVTLQDLDAVAYTEGPGLAGALLVGASIAASLAYGLGVPAIGVHHLEGHLLSPLLSARPPAFPFVALLVSGGHTQLMRVEGVGSYALLGETADDAAGEAFDKTAQLLGLGYPGGPALAALADRGRAGRFKLPRPVIASGDLDFSFSGLKTAVATARRGAAPSTTRRAPISRRSSRKRSSTCWSRSAARRSRRPASAASWSPAASARTGACASGSTRPRAPMGSRRSTRSSSSAPTTAR